MCKVSAKNASPTELSTGRRVFAAVMSLAVSRTAYELAVTGIEVRSSARTGW